MVMGKFKIPSVPATTNKTIRFPNDVVEQVEQAIQGKDCTFSAFVIAAVRSVFMRLFFYSTDFKDSTISTFFSRKYIMKLTSTANTAVSSTENT